jgi:hypothetical protein
LAALAPFSKSKRIKAMHATGTICAAILSVLCLGPISQANATAADPETLTIVETPGGGQYVYGKLAGKNSVSDALVFMLKQVHGHFGNKPQIGKFFQSRGNGSVATFFSVVAKYQGNKPLSGLLIVAHAQDNTTSAAVLTDDASRFATTEPKMLRALSAVWHPTGRTSGALKPASAPAAIVPVRVSEVTGGDRSAAIDLPANWHLKSVSAGSLIAIGPNDERVSLGLIYQNLPFYIQSDLFSAFVNANNLVRQRNGLPAATYDVISATDLPGQAIQVIFNVDLHDGIGVRKGSARVGFLGPHAITVSASNIPFRLADRKKGMLLAIIHSYRQNNAVIAREGAADLARVQADADRAAVQAAALNQRREANAAAFDQHMSDMDRSHSSFDQHMDDIDRGSKMTQDYILDRSVVRDNDTNERGTVNNSYAESLVRANPDRFELVGNQDLIRGKDY